jgi:hypothetical protein
MIDISDFDKDQLAEYAHNVYGVELDMRKGLENLRKEVIKLQTKNSSENLQVIKIDPKATHIKNNETGFWFPWTPQLHKYLTDYTLCDENGNDVI